MGQADLELQKSLDESIAAHAARLHTKDENLHTKNKKKSGDGFVAAIVVFLIVCALVA